MRGRRIHEDFAQWAAVHAIRVYEMHGVTASLDWGHRQASYPFQADVWQRASVVSVFYTLLQGW